VCLTEIVLSTKNRHGTMDSLHVSKDRMLLVFLMI